MENPSCQGLSASPAGQHSKHCPATHHAFRALNTWQTISKGTNKLVFLPKYGRLWRKKPLHNFTILVFSLSDMEDVGKIQKNEQQLISFYNQDK